MLSASADQTIGITYSASVGEEVRANGLNVALSGTGQATDRLEILVGSPARRQGRKRNVDNLNRSHGGGVGMED